MIEDEFEQEDSFDVPDDEPSGRCCKCGRIISVDECLSRCGCVFYTGGHS